MRILTPEQLRLQADISVAAAIKEHADRRYYDLVRSCKDHLYTNEYDSAICCICGSDGGWWCPDSETHTCDYTDGEFCIHCGAPDERK